MVKTKAEVDKIVKEAIALLSREITVDGAFLFGSYSTGSAHEDSDIDIAVFSKSVDSWPLDSRLRLAASVKDVSPYIELHLYPGAYLKEARPTNLYGHIIETGKKVA
jgi:predicted nucleotidyltransferase